jgi:hypothetical protein
MIRVEASRVIDRPIEDVWAYMANLDNMPDWDPGLMEVSWQPPLRLGLDVRMQDESPMLSWIERVLGPFIFRVTEFEATRRFGLRVTRGASYLEAIYTLEPAGPEGTRVTRVSTLDGHGPWKLLELGLKRRALREREAEVTNLKRILESDSAGGDR